MLTSLVGKQNIVITDLRTLEKSKFETANLYNKCLAVITDAAHYGGGVEVLKAITGGDSLRYERKNVQAGESFIFQGMVMIASNENIQTTDYTSGLSRRKITVPFTHIISEAEKTNDPDFEARLTAELPGLFNQLLLLDADTVNKTIRAPGEVIKNAKFQAELDTNPMMAWLHEMVMQCNNGFETTVGLKTKERHLPDNTKLYPSYYDYCGDRGRHAVSLTRFSALVIDICMSRGITTKKERRGEGTFLTNLRLRQETDPENGLFEVKNAESVQT